MDIDKLYKACALFQKLAQRIPKTPKASDVNFYGKLLFHALQSYANLLSSPAVANRIFKACETHNKSPATTSDATNRQLLQIEGAIEESSAKLRAMGKEPIAVLTKMGATNLNANSLNVMLANLKVLQEGIDFSKYQHYYLPAHGEPKEIIDLDTEIDTGPGY